VQDIAHDDLASPEVGEAEIGLKFE